MENKGPFIKGGGVSNPTMICDGGGEGGGWGGDSIFM